MSKKEKKKRKEKKKKKRKRKEKKETASTALRLDKEPLSSCPNGWQIIQLEVVGRGCGLLFLIHVIDLLTSNLFLPLHFQRFFLSLSF